MGISKKSRFYLLLCALSFVFSYLIITLEYFPHLGFAISLSAFAVLAYKHKKQKTVDTRIYFFLTLAFSALLFIRSEPFITFLNLASAIFFTLLMLTMHHRKELGLLDYLVAPAVLALKTLFTASDYSLEYKAEKTKLNKTKAFEIIFGLTISIFILAVILPLLSYSNPFFQNILDNLLSALNLKNLINSINIERLILWIVRFIFFLIFAFVLPRILTLIKKDSDYSVPIALNTDSLPLVIPKVVVTIVLSVFFVTQMQFYLAEPGTLAEMGITHSERTREVFAQLSLVAGVVLLLIYTGKNRSNLDKSLSWILGIHGIFLTLMAYKSVFEYIDTWGLTYKRLYGLAFATWIIGVFFLFFENYRLAKPKSIFIRKGIVFSALVLILINVFNFDYLIYKYKKAETGQGIDYTYLSALSSDSLSYDEQFAVLQDVTEKGDAALSEYDNKNPLLLIRKIENLQRKYDRFDFRTLTLLDLIQYQSLKNLDTSALRTHYQNTPSQN